MKYSLSRKESPCNTFPRKQSTEEPSTSYKPDDIIDIGRSESLQVILVIRRGGRLDAGYVDASSTRTPCAVGYGGKRKTEGERGNAQTPGVPTSLPRWAATENPTPWLRRRCTRGPTPLFYHADVRPWPLAGQPRIVLLRRRGAASLAANSTADLIRDAHDFPSPGKKRSGVPLRSDGKLASLPARLRRPGETARRARTWLRRDAGSWWWSATEGDKSKFSRVPERIGEREREREKERETLDTGRQVEESKGRC